MSSETHMWISLCLLGVLTVSLRGKGFFYWASDLQFNNKHPPFPGSIWKNISLPIHRSYWEPLYFSISFLLREGADRCNGSDQFHYGIPNCCYRGSQSQNWQRINHGSEWRSHGNLDRNRIVWSKRVPWMSCRSPSCDVHCHWLGHVTRVCRLRQLALDELCHTLELWINNEIIMNKTEIVNQSAKQASPPGKTKKVTRKWSHVYLPFGQFEPKYVFCFSPYSFPWWVQYDCVSFYCGWKASKVICVCFSCITSLCDW